MGKLLNREKDVTGDRKNLLTNQSVLFSLMISFFKWQTRHHRNVKIFVPFRR